MRLTVGHPRRPVCHLCDSPAGGRKEIDPRPRAPLHACPCAGLCAPWLRVRVACVPAPLPAFACAHRPAGVPACVRALGPAPLRVCAPARMMRARVASFVPALAGACAGARLGAWGCTRSEASDLPPRKCLTKLASAFTLQMRPFLLTRLA